MASVGAKELIASLNREIEGRLGQILPRGRPVALIGFPSYNNVGDSAVWLGALSFLKHNQNRVVYVCDRWSYAREDADRRIDDALILIAGGGNFGDLYPQHQLLRERVIADFPDRSIVQLPQTIWFEHRTALERARASISAHPDLTLLVRDRKSLLVTEREFEAPAALCPDLAFALGSLDRSRNPQTEVVWLSRTDEESAFPPKAGGPDVEIVDWVGDELGGRTWSRAHVELRRLLVNFAWVGGQRGRTLSRLRPRMWRLYDLHARQRLAYGSQLLGRGRAVVTDRLHGHILCVLLGIPHVLLDNSYGKLASFHTTWTSDLEFVRWASSTAEAVELSEAIVEELSSQP